jgi:hypothetical protein
MHWWLKQQKVIFSYFWRLQVQDPSASNLSLWCGLSFLAYRQPPSCCVLTWQWGSGGWRVTGEGEGEGEGEGKREEEGEGEEQIHRVTISSFGLCCNHSALPL